MCNFCTTNYRRTIHMHATTNATQVRRPPAPPPHPMLRICILRTGLLIDISYFSFFFSSDPRLRHTSSHTHDILHFTFSDSITKFHVSNATLYLYIKGSERHPLPEMVVEIFKVYKMPDRDEAPSLYRVFAKKMKQPLGRGDFIRVDFSETISEWFKSPRDNFGFVVNATVNGRKVVVTDTTVDNGNKVSFKTVEKMQNSLSRSASLNLLALKNYLKSCYYTPLKCL